MRISFKISLCALLWSYYLPFSSAQQSQPNIVLVITDDQGKNDLGCEGNPLIKTPNLDKLHSEAIRMTNFHVSTTCTPTRGALMTGRHTNRLNAYHTIAGRSILFADEVILPQILAQAGYATGMFGKWHLGDNYPYRPLDRGFQEVVRHGGGGVGQNPDYWGNDYFDDTYWKNGVPTPYSGYCTDVFFDEALAFIENHQDGPFFCYLSTNAPHGPLNVPEAYLDIYEDMDLTEREKRFYGMITNIDDNFARLEKKLKDLNLRENTIVVYMTDNGTAFGHQAFDAGMRGNKGSVLEGGHRVPCYLRWPAGDLGGGVDVPELTAHFDLLPTLVDLAKVAFHPVKPLDGTSWRPLFDRSSGTWKKRILYVDTQRLTNLVKYKAYSVMEGEWRLVNGNQLYDLSSDSRQEKNIIENHPQIASTLREGYEKWWSSIMAEEVAERHAPLVVGSEFQNPSCIHAHDLLSAMPSRRWHQFGCIDPAEGLGTWKLEVESEGLYEIAVRRFPQESNLAINAAFAAAPQQRRLAASAPASTKTDFIEAYVNLATLDKRQEITANAEEVVFETQLSPGLYDLTAYLIDSQGKYFPSYYTYISKLSP